MASTTPHPPVPPPRGSAAAPPDASEYDVDAQSEDSFPASDPPSYSGSVVGGSQPVHAATTPARQVKRVRPDLAFVLAGVVLILVGVAIWFSARAH